MQNETLVAQEPRPYSPALTEALPPTHGSPGKRRIRDWAERRRDPLKFCGFTPTELQEMTAGERKIITRWLRPDYVTLTAGIAFATCCATLATLTSARQPSIELRAIIFASSIFVFLLSIALLGWRRAFVPDRSLGLTIRYLIESMEQSPKSHGLMRDRMRARATRSTRRAMVRAGDAVESAELTQIEDAVVHGNITDAHRADARRIALRHLRGELLDRERLLHRQPRWTEVGQSVSADGMLVKLLVAVTAIAGLVAAIVSLTATVLKAKGA